MSRLRESPHFILGRGDSFRREAEDLEYAARSAYAWSPLLSEQMRRRAKQLQRAADRCKLIAQKAGVR